MRKRMDRLGPNSTIRITVTIPTQTKEAIDQYAEEMGITMANATQHFLKVGMTAEAIALEGGEVIARYPSGTQIPIANKNGNFIYRQALMNSEA